MAEPPRPALRRATLADAATVFRWRNLPFIVKLGSQNRKVSWSEHVRWFRRAVGGRRHLLLLIRAGARDVGQVRFDRTGERACDVSIYLVPPYVGRGWGAPSLREACRIACGTWRVDRVRARIRRDNERSRRAFEAAGFVAPEISGGAFRDYFWRP